MQHKSAGVVLLLLLLPLLVFGQDDGEWYLNKPILDIQFEGLDNISENDLEGVVEPFLDQPFTEPLLLDIQRRIYNLEYFELIIPEAVPGDENRNSMILKFTVEERPVLSDIRFEGNSKVRREALRDEIVLKLGDLVSRSQARLDQDAIAALYKDKGFADVSVSFEITDTPAADDNAQILTFKVNEGFQTNVSEVIFSGISFATENKLKSVIETKEQGLFNPGTFKSSNLEIDRQAILQYYGENGYVDAQVLDIDQNLVLNEDQGRQFLEITYFIEEGDAWFFGEISFEGNSIFKDDELRNRVRLDDGEILDSLKLQTGLQQVSDLYYQGGYIFNEIDVTEDRNEALRQISYTVSITEQSRAYIENIIVRGNTKTKDEVIFRELPFEEGDVFSASKIREGISNLYNTQYFAGPPTVDTPPGSAPGLMDLIITLEEGQTTDVRLGFSVGGGEDVPIAGIVQWNDSNFLGNGQSIGADANISPASQQLALTFNDGWLFGDRWAGGARLSVNRSLRTDGLQDILAPLFDINDYNAVPDPYEGTYFFTVDGTSYNSTTYNAGDSFPGFPTLAEISTYNLATDYQLAGGSSSVGDEYRMEYVQWTIGSSFSSSIRRSTPLGWAGIGASLSFNLETITYDDEYYRPFQAGIRENLGIFQWTNTIGLNLSLDNRDVFFNPQNGYLIEQNFRFTGGLLAGSQNFVRSDTTLQGYLRLVDAEVTDSYSFKVILAANSTLSLLLPQFDPYSNEVGFSGDKYLLATNSMTIARGWPLKRDLLGLWNNWIELRLPIDESILWLDFFFEAVRYVEYSQGYEKGSTLTQQIFEKGTNNWLFGFGGGFRFSIPQFPFRIYLAKLFELDDSGNPDWFPGNVFQNDDKENSGLSLIFAISLF